MTGRARGGSRPVSFTGQARGIGQRPASALAVSSAGEGWSVLARHLWPGPGKTLVGTVTQTNTVTETVRDTVTDVVTVTEQLPAETVTLPAETVTVVVTETVASGP
jgi:hypothetical protein